MSVAEPSPWVRPTTRAGSAGARRWLVASVALAAGVLVIMLAVAWRQDRDGHYPGRRSAAVAAIPTAGVLPPIGSELDGFEVDGPLGGVGGWPWQAAAGPKWSAERGLTRAGGDGGAVVVDPGAEVVMAQVDVYRPTPRAGLVFGWQGTDDHFRLVVDDDSAGWVLEQVAGGTATELARLAGPTHGTNVRVTLRPGRVVVALDGQARRAVDVDDLGGTALGLVSPGDATRFGQFAVLVG